MSKTVSQSNRSYANWIGCHPSIAKQLPLDDSFQKRDLPDEVEAHFWQLAEDDLIKTVDEERPRSGGGHEWRVNREAVAQLERLRESHSGRLPCGHDGFRNLRDSPYYECTVCEEQYTREEIE